MINFQTLKESKLPINWKTILIGWYGPGKFPSQLTISDVASYAMEMLDTDPIHSDCILSLVIAGQDDGDLVSRCLHKLADNITTSSQTETRKWCLILLKDLLNSLSNDPIYGLLQLTEFWEHFNYPEDGPHVVQGINNQIVPKDYYTEENFNQTKELHYKWVLAEESILMKT